MSRSCTCLSCGLTLYSGRSSFRASSKEDEEISERARDSRVAVAKGVEEWRVTMSTERRRSMEDIDLLREEGGIVVLVER